jgi:hypothetical protein
VRTLIPGLAFFLAAAAVGCSQQGSAPSSPSSLSAALPSSLSATTGSAKRKNGRNVAVTTTIDDAYTGVAPTLQIQSDMTGPCKDSRTLDSFISSNGNWLLDLTVNRIGNGRLPLRVSNDSWQLSRTFARRLRATLNHPDDDTLPGFGRDA